MCIDSDAIRTGTEAAGDVILAEGAAGTHAVWWETLPIVIAGNLAALLTTIRPSDLRLQLDIVHARQLAETPIDNLLIISDQRLVLEARVDHGSLATLSTIGLDYLELIHPLQHESMIRLMELAKATPGDVYKGQTIVRRLDGMRTATLRIQYRQNRYGGGRWYTATHVLSPIGGQICDRLMMAYGAASQTELAKCIGVDRSAVSRHSRADDVPANWIIDCWKKTGTSTDWLLTGHGKPNTF
ncbi:MAG: helix-turn-helix domain-containing protein [Halodesulfovibrio sp.]